MRPSNRRDEIGLSHARLPKKSSGADRRNEPRSDVTMSSRTRSPAALAVARSSEWRSGAGRNARVGADVSRLEMGWKSQGPRRSTPAVGERFESVFAS